ncbi:type VI secretion system protein TssA [Nitrosomonas sp.]|uniref:type VI secretion system protein TssA n=1 Tax=Nitrosomonas sp. TaxID=42353 RepID=UPI002842AD29|nr:type VI secretion system protein TssA [Nitrosomonas sp.]MDR4515603.1 type VI secretion system protein TssA [Nitrosomonas sp.]
MNLDLLLKPIPGDEAAGQDMSFSIEIDDLKEARRSDDPDVPQGDWEQEVKEADWSKVENIASDVIANKSKDLQFAVWLLEALTQKYRFEGLNEGLMFVRQFLETFWHDLYPKIEDDDLSYRISPLEWLNTNLPGVIYSLSLCSEAVEKCSWQDVQQAREVENLGRRDPEAMAKAVEEGKLCQADVDKRIKETPNEFFLKNHEWLTQCRQSFTDFQKVANDIYVIKNDSSGASGKSEAPSLRDIGSAIDNVLGFVEQVLKNRKLLGVDSTETEGIQINSNGGDAAMHDSSGETPSGSVTSNIDSVGVKRILAGGSIQSREEALRLVAEVSLFFKRTEPHSPIYYLLDRAVRWGSIPLDQWLNEMINEGWNDLPTLLRLIGKKESSDSDESDNTSSV